MAIVSSGYTGAVDNVQWAQMAGSLGFDYVAKGANDCKVTTVSTGTRTVRVATGSIAGGGVLDVNDSVVDIALPNVTSGSKWFMIVADRTWQTTNATTFTYIEGTATKQLPPRITGFGVRDQQPLALVRIAAGQTLPAEIIDLRVVGSNNGVMVGFDELCLQYIDAVGTVVRIGTTEWSRGLTPVGAATWIAQTAVTTSPFSAASGYAVHTSGALTLVRSGDEISAYGTIKRTAGGGAFSPGVFFTVGSIPAGWLPVANGVIGAVGTFSGPGWARIQGSSLQVALASSGTMPTVSSNPWYVSLNGCRWMAAT